MEDAEKRSQETYHFSRMRVESVCACASTSIYATSASISLNSVKIIL